MIIKAEEQIALEMARRAKTKVTRQGLVDNDPILPIFKHVRKFLKNYYLFYCIYLFKERIRFNRRH